MSANASRRPRICIATTMGGYDHASVLDSVLARALDVRGADVEVLLCNKGVPTCQMIKIGPTRAMPEELAAQKPMSYCDFCVDRGEKMFGKLGYPVQSLGDYITPVDAEFAKRTAESIPFEDIRAFEWYGLPVGDHAFAGALRYFARGDLENEPYGEQVLRVYLEAGLRTIAAIRRMIQQRRYDILVINHGIYIPQGMIAEVARGMGVKVVTYNPAYRKHSFVFSHNESYHFTMLEEPVEHWNKLDMTPELMRDIRAYLWSRRSGTNDWIWFHDAPKEDIAPVLAEVGCDPSKPYVALLTSVVWDAQLHYKANAFPNMLDWLVQTVEHWGKRDDDLQLVIRVHPAEVRGSVPSRQLCAEELRKAFPDGLPKNVFVLEPANQASTYALCENANSVIIYNTKAGVEMASMGVPVIVAGEAWVRGKGFAIDASSPEDYFRILDGLPLPEAMTPERRLLADRYAYHFFFRRMIPLPFIRVWKTGHFVADIKDKNELKPGAWPGLDTICEGILTGKPFIYPAEHLADPFPGEAAAPEAAA
jgi:hypothetical protein